MVNKRSILSRSAQKYEINYDEELVWRLDITLLAYTIQALEASERNADSQSDNQMNFLKTIKKILVTKKVGSDFSANGTMSNEFDHGGSDHIYYAS